MARVYLWLRGPACSGVQHGPKFTSGYDPPPKPESTQIPPCGVRSAFIVKAERTPQARALPARRRAVRAAHVRDRRPRRHAHGPRCRCACTRIGTSSAAPRRRRARARRQAAAAARPAAAMSVRCRSITRASSSIPIISSRLRRAARRTIRTTPHRRRRLRGSKRCRWPRSQPWRRRHSCRGNALAACSIR